MAINRKIKPSTRGSVITEIHEHNISIDTREIYLHSFLEEEGDCGVEYRMSNIFLKNLKLLESIDSELPIVIHQHSVGGEWESGMLIYDAIATSKTFIIVVTHGIAASMGSVIPQAADLRVVMPNCFWMIHEGYAGDHSGLTHRASQSWSQLAEILNKKMYEIYISACADSEKFKNKTPRQIKNQIKKHLNTNGDWFLSSEEAVEYGFADAVYGSLHYSNLEELKSHVC